MVGVAFRLQGSDPATGLDCVGLVAAAYAATGRCLIRPVGYPLRGWSRVQVETALTVAGFVPVIDEIVAGDIALFVQPARQFHLGLLGRATFVHAHAGLRRVVETPLDATTRSAPRWRLS